MKTGFNDLLSKFYPNPFMESRAMSITWVEIPPEGGSESVSEFSTSCQDPCTLYTGPAKINLKMHRSYFATPRVLHIPALQYFLNVKTKFYVKIFFGSQRILGKNIFKVNKNFGSKNIVGSKKILGENKF